MSKYNLQQIADTMNKWGITKTSAELEQLIPDVKTLQSKLAQSPPEAVVFLAALAQKEIGAELQAIDPCVTDANSSLLCWSMEFVGDKQSVENAKNWSRGKKLVVDLGQKESQSTVHANKYLSRERFYIGVEV